MGHVAGVHQCRWRVRANARIVFDRFHVQRLAHDASTRFGATDAKARRNRRGQVDQETRWALHKNPWNLTGLEHDKVAQVTRQTPLYRAYAQESLARSRGVSSTSHARSSTSGSGAAPIAIARVQEAREDDSPTPRGILGHIATGLSNGPVEGLNGKIRTITRRAYGFHTPPTSLPSSPLLPGLVFVPSSRRPFTPTRMLESQKKRQLERQLIRQIQLPELNATRRRFAEPYSRRYMLSFCR